MFKDRQDAGQKLGKALEKYKDKDVLVLAIPKGGVEIGHEVAQYLNADFSILIARKLPFPFNPEAGFGAIAEDGTYYVMDRLKSGLSEEDIARIVDQQKDEIKRRIEVLRKSEPLPDLKDKTVILTDDGIATGSTMTVSVKLCKKQRADKIVVATPVAGQHTIKKFQKMVDEVEVLESPANFRAVAQVYENWYDVSDEEVLEIIYGDG